MTIALAGLFDLPASAFEPEAAIAALAHAPPLWDVGTAKWMVYTDGLAQFAGRWGKPAQACAPGSLWRCTDCIRSSPTPISHAWVELGSSP